jgi:hypothetical protein
VNTNTTPAVVRTKAYVDQVTLPADSEPNG